VLYYLLIYDIVANGPTPFCDKLSVCFNLSPQIIYISFLGFSEGIRNGFFLTSVYVLLLISFFPYSSIF